MNKTAFADLVGIRGSGGVSRAMGAGKIAKGGTTDMVPP